MKRLALLMLIPPAFLGAACRASNEKTGFVVLPGMVEAVPVESYDRTTSTPNGAALMRPPEGTVPIEGAPFRYGPGPVEAARAGTELQDPLATTPANVERGKAMFGTYCSVCHGEGGQGDGPIVGGANRFPNPPSLTAAHAKNLPDGRIFHIATRGQGIMPAHASQIRPDDRWRIVQYLRTLQFPAGAPSRAPAPAVTVAALPKEPAR